MILYPLGLKQAVSTHLVQRAIARVRAYEYTFCRITHRQSYYACLLISVKQHYPFSLPSFMRRLFPAR